MSNEPEALRKEAQRLRAMITHAEQRLAEIEQLLVLMEKYGLLPRGPQAIAGATADLERSLRSRCMPSQRVQVTETCAEILSDGVRRLSRELLPLLEQRGIKLGGRNPKGLLATYLSKDDRFISKQGWTLRQAPIVVTTGADSRAHVTENPNQG